MYPCLTRYVSNFILEQWYSLTCATRAARRDPGITLEDWPDEARDLSLDPCERCCVDCSKIFLCRSPARKIFDSSLVLNMKMSRGLSRAQQTQMRKVQTQAYAASKGVHYCDTCVQKRLRKKDKAKRKPVWDLPPMCIVYMWLLICGMFYSPDAADWFLTMVRYLSWVLFLGAAVFDCVWYSVITYKRITRPVLDPQAGVWEMDPFLKEAIQVWCLFESLRDARTKRGMIAAVTQYMQAHVKESLPLHIYRLFTRDRKSVV